MAKKEWVYHTFPASKNNPNHYIVLDNRFDGTDVLTLTMGGDCGASLTRTKMFIHFQYTPKIILKASDAMPPHWRIH